MLFAPAVWESFGKFCMRKHIGLHIYCPYFIQLPTIYYLMLQPQSWPVFRSWPITLSIRFWQSPDYPTALKKNTQEVVFGDIHRQHSNRFFLACVYSVWVKITKKYTFCYTSQSIRSWGHVILKVLSWACFVWRWSSSWSCFRTQIFPKLSQTAGEQNLW